MKLPKNIDKITIDSEISFGAYPPNGFLKFEEGALGNGDYFGLYWEFGKENQEPIVCEMMHEEGKIVPAFSNLDKFLEWYELNNYDWGEEEIEDIEHVYHYLAKGNEYLRQNNPQKAIYFYEKSAKSFGETSENWYKLASQYKRLGNELEFQKCIIHAINSNWAIEFPSQNTIRLFKNLKPLSELNSHPLVRYRDKLNFKFGGTKENDNYLILQDIIWELSVIGETVKSLLLEQNYALMMYWETSAFQDRYNFNLEDWKKQFQLKVKEKFNRIL